MTSYNVGWFISFPLGQKGFILIYNITALMYLLVLKLIRVKTTTLICGGKL